jgi:GTP-binding protein HflX
LEIELASIGHMGPRIYGMGMELSRQGGGIGTSGVGETNTEIMKRHLRARERTVREKLESCQVGRDLQRKNRERKGLKSVAIVGYTNAGKTTLLNALTGRREYAANELFATLDTRVGSLFLPGARKTVLVSDTIGFIRDLPPDLIKAFQSTLSEAVSADLLIHVVDASDKNALRHIDVVEDVLDKLHVLATPRIIALNKTDAATAAAVRRMRGQVASDVPVVAVSAVTGAGIGELVESIERILEEK